MSRDAVTATPTEAGLEHRHHTLGDPDGVLGIRGFLDEDGELVATETRCRVRRAEHELEAVGNPREQLVACHVAEAVVDLLEIIEVEEHHGE